MVCIVGIEVRHIDFILAVCILGNVMNNIFRLVGIKVSLASEPQMFMAYNNGISTVADSIDIDESQSSGDVVTITEITGWQIGSLIEPIVCRFSLRNRDWCCFG